MQGRAVEPAAGHPGHRPPCRGPVDDQGARPRGAHPQGHLAHGREPAPVRRGEGVEVGRERRAPPGVDAVAAAPDHLVGVLVGGQGQRREVVVDLRLRRVRTVDVEREHVGVLGDRQHDAGDDVEGGDTVPAVPAVGDIGGIGARRDRRGRAFVDHRHRTAVREAPAARREQAVEVVVDEGQGRRDGHVHVEVPVGAEPPAEGDPETPFQAHQLAVRREPAPVGCRVDRVVGLVTRPGDPAAFAHHHGPVGGVGALGVEVPELEHPGAGVGLVGEVEHRGPLVVPDGEHLLLEVQGAPAQGAVRVVEPAVERAGVDHGDPAHEVGSREVVPVVEDVGPEAHGDAGVVGHPGQPGGVAVDRQALPAVGEVAVVVGVAHRQPGDDLGGQLGRVGLPLLGGVAPHERLVQRAADERDRLLLEVGRVTGQLAGLPRDERPGLLGPHRGPEELVDGAEVDRHRVDLATVHGPHPVDVAGEGREAVDVGPDPRVAGVEQVRPVAVHLDARARLDLAPGVAPDVVAAVDDDHVEASGCRTLGDREPVEARADDDEVGPHQTPSRSTGRATGVASGRGRPADGCRCQGGATGRVRFAATGGATVKVRR